MLLVKAALSIIAAVLTQLSSNYVKGVWEYQVVHANQLLGNALRFSMELIFALLDFAGVIQLPKLALLRQV